MAVAVVALVVAVANAAALVAIHRRARAQRDRLDELATRAARLEEQARVVTPDVARVLDSTRKRVIVIELLDPIGLARQRVSLAGPVGGLAPRAIERIVHEQTVKTLREVLVEYGVEAEVELHVA